MQKMIFITGNTCEFLNYSIIEWNILEVVQIDIREEERQIENWEERNQELAGADLEEGGVERVPAVAEGAEGAEEAEGVGRRV
jgi:hypothetical protein